MSTQIGVQPVDLSLEDLKSPENFMAFKGWIDQVTQGVNTLFGLHGPVPVFSDIDMQGVASVTNMRAPAASSDAVTLDSAQSSFGPSAIKTAVEATGTQILQTTRRINDQSQREMHSTFLNDVLNVPPVTNGATVSVTSNGDGTSQIVVTANNFEWGDGSIAPFAQRSDRVTNPASGSNFYFYYFRKTDNTLQFIGPFTSNTPQNQFGAYTDGRGFVGTAQVNAGGGGTGGGGASGAGSGGCLEVGTPVQPPEGKAFRFFVEPCDDWIIVHFKDGRRIKAARGTMIGVFVAVENLKEHDLGKGIDGSFNPVDRIEEDHTPGMKMHATVEGGVYGGDGIEFHNFKPAV